MEKRVPKPTATAVLGMMAGLLLSIPAAQAWDVKYNFTASGRILTLTGAGAEYTEGPEKTVSGAVTFKVLRVAPPADAITDFATYALYNGDGWIETEWEGSIDDGVAIEPEPWPTGVLVHSVAVHNGYDPDVSDYSSQDTVKYYYDTSDPYGYGERSAGISRQIYAEAPWFTGLVFDPGRSPQYNFLWVNNYKRDSTGTYTGFASSFLIDDWTLASIDLLPLANKLESVPQGKGLSVLIGFVQAYYDAGDTTSACAMLTAFTRQAGGLAHNQNFVEMAEDAILDAELIGKILGCN